MTADDRRRIREAIDARARQQRLRRVEHGDLGDLDTCRGCGCDTDCRTAGCRTCNSRWLKRKLRSDPNYRYGENLQQRWQRHHHGEHDGDDGAWRQQMGERRRFCLWLRHTYLTASAA